MVLGAALDQSLRDCHNNTYNEKRTKHYEGQILKLNCLVRNHIYRRKLSHSLRELLMNQFTQNG